MADRTGQFGLGKIPGRVGRWIWIGQLINGDLCPFAHAYGWVDDTHAVEAMPGGAVITERWRGQPEAKAPFSHFDLPPENVAAVAAAWRDLVGTPYSFLDYGSLALARLRIRPERVKRYVADTGHMICSQLMDEGFRRGGVHLFDDGRIPGDVTPGALYKPFIVQRKQPAWIEGVIK
jgi:hypothetical protein